MMSRFPIALAICAGIASVCAAEPPRLLDAPVSLGSARSFDLPAEPSDGSVRPASADDMPRSRPVVLGRPRDSRPLEPDERRILEDRSDDTSLAPVRRVEADDFLDRRSNLGRDRDAERTRSSGKFGDKLRDWLAPGGGRDTWLFSDHAFDQFATPISNPFLAEDPRALTEVRPIFIYQNVPSPQPNFQGGNIFFFGGRASIALTERFSFTINKLGGLALGAKNKSFRDSEFGFAELWFGPKFTFYRDPQDGTLASAGAIFQLPSGPAKIFQDTGNFSIAPYVSVGKTLWEFRELGSFNGILNAGYAFAGNRERSEYFYATAHLDFDVRNNHRLYPVAELNWFQYTRSGSTQSVSGEGHDLFNFGSKSRGASLVTGALGARYKITEAAQIGAAFELPLIGNKDVFQYRFTMDVIFRY
ncbi:MAG: hypothetical protein KF873_23235 [Gemmataceae bacterium]|nr:hypothetical protein [Gemmataceae bacterium]